MLLLWNNNNSEMSCTIKSQVNKSYKRVPVVTTRPTNSLYLNSVLVEEGVNNY